MRRIEKRAQQEIAGFVLIAALVIISLMIFVVISLKKPQPTIKSQSANDFLTSLMRYTTDCIVSQPNQESIEDLIKNCYNNKKCRNLDKSACFFLNESLTEILSEVDKREVSIDAYELLMIYSTGDKDNPIETKFFSLTEGSCGTNTTVIGGGPAFISANDGIIKVYVKFCSSKY